ncbi:RNA polymerase sigma-70 factor [Membranihabitans maritimus]|uniref:RNA polymerase sigma-70 factor n=1 Tax=Membranihabitans maritimus TaxID=2904244 RepID=UPI001F433D32|nr:RNA polymerase sigma-70 factor [Membranihabitans maritimus]
MSIEPGEGRKGMGIRSLKVARDSNERDKNGMVDKVVASVDNERFLREAFSEDEWLGCTLLFEHYYAPLCSHSIRFVYSREYAEDVVAEVFREFWQRKHFRKITTTFRTYLFRAVRNRSLNFIRRELRQTLPSNGDLPIVSDAMRPDEQMMYDQFYQKIQKSIDQLPPKCKKIFLMSRFEGKSLKEIARSQDISIRTVETHISKALSALREVLKDQ